jgi:hypothetical protein
MSPLASSPTVGRIVVHLAERPGDVGCRHLAREDFRVEASLLVDLGLVKPIMSRVPACSVHGCPRRGACRWEADFLPEASGNKANVKYRRTADGDVVAAGSLATIEERLATLPLANAVLAEVADGPRSLFAIQGRLVEEARAEVKAGKNTERVAPNRPVLLSVVRLLAELGVVGLSEDGVVYSM